MCDSAEGVLVRARGGARRSGWRREEEGGKSDRLPRSGLLDFNRQVLLRLSVGLLLLLQLLLQLLLPLKLLMPWPSMLERRTGAGGRCGRLRGVVSLTMVGREVWGGGPVWGGVAISVHAVVVVILHLLEGVSVPLVLFL